MQALNNFEIIGRLVRDLQIFESSNGTEYTYLSIANSKKQKDGTEKANYFSMIAFGKTASLLSDFLKKGDRVYLQGEISQESVLKEDQNYETKTTMIVNDFLLLESKKEEGGETTEKEDFTAKKSRFEKKQKKEEEISIDDVPF